MEGNQLKEYKDLSGRLLLIMEDACIATGVILDGEDVTQKMKLIHVDPHLQWVVLVEADSGIVRRCILAEETYCKSGMVDPCVWEHHMGTTREIYELDCDASTAKKRFATLNNIGGLSMFFPSMCVSVMLDALYPLGPDENKEQTMKP